MIPRLGILTLALVWVGLAAGCGDSSTTAPGPPPCPNFDTVEIVGRVESPAIQETSGLVVSRQQEDVLWLHNDSGDEAFLFAIASDGRLRARVRLETTARDWEDLAIGPGPKPGVDYLYIGDIGDNFSLRDSIQIHRIEEPRASGMNEEIPAEAITTFDLRYPDGAHDAETLVIDPRTGDLFIVIKTLFAPGPTLLYRFSAAAQSEGGDELEFLGPVDFPEGDFTTGGDISPDGSEIVVRGYREARLWRRANGESIRQAFSGEACTVPVIGTPEEPQGEAIAFAVGGPGYFTLSEGVDQPIYRFSP